MQVVDLQYRLHRRRRRQCGASCFRSAIRHRRVAVNELDRVGVLRVRQDLPLRALLEKPAVAHDRDPVAGLRYDAEIVGDEDDRQAARVAKFDQQLQDLRTDGHVERGRRLVGDQDFRIAGQRHADHGALAHATGELVRIAVILTRRVWKTDLRQDLDRGRTGCPPVEALMITDALGNLIADPHHRIEMARRVLEDHADLAAADVEHLGIADGSQVAPFEKD